MCSSHEAKIIPRYYCRTQTHRITLLRNFFQDSKMAWKKHNQQKGGTGYQMKNVLLTGGKSTLSLENKILLYKVIVKPIWKYGKCEHNSEVLVWNERTIMDATGKCKICPDRRRIQVLSRKAFW